MVLHKMMSLIKSRMRYLSIAALVSVANLVPLAVSAQSVLESVLARLEIGQETLLPLLATNMAVNTGWSTSETTLDTAQDDALIAIVYGDYFDPDTGAMGTQQWGIYKSDLGTTLASVETFFYEDIHVDADGTIWAENSDGYVDTFTVFDATGALFGGDGLLIDSGIGAALDIIANDAAVYTDGTSQYVLSPASAAQVEALERSFDDVYNDFQINASISNSVQAAIEASAAAVPSATATAAFSPTVDLGDMSTTGLGAVNTGEIVLGVNSALDSALNGDVAAVSGRVEAIGTTFGEMALVWNDAYNDVSIDASISNVVQNVNLTAANLSTTALGAVNTGAIVSGVHASVQGIVGTAGMN